jgi:hypothetical protein
MVFWKPENMFWMPLQSCLSKYGSLDAEPTYSFSVLCTLKPEGGYIKLITAIDILDKPQKVEIHDCKNHG